MVSPMGIVLQYANISRICPIGFLFHLDYLDLCLIELEAAVSPGIQAGDIIRHRDMGDCPDFKRGHWNGADCIGLGFD